MARQPDIQYINAYVSGNIAYQMDVQPARKKRVRLPKPKAKKQMVLHVDPVAVLAIMHIHHVVCSSFTFLSASYGLFWHFSQEKSILHGNWWKRSFCLEVLKRHMV